MKRLKSKLILILILSIISQIFSTYYQVSLKVNLQIPEYLIIKNLSKNELNFVVENIDNNSTFVESLSFAVEGNVDYLISLDFLIDDSLNESIKDFIQETYKAYIKEKDFESSQVIVDTKENSFAFRNKGFNTYQLFFEIDVSHYSGNYLPEFTGKVGNIEIIVAKYDS